VSPPVRAAALPADLLALPAGEAARRIALAELARAEAARAALAAGEDPEALHDFRVALRRLRSQVRAYRDEIARAMGRKLRRRLRRLAAATNPGRDAEVGIALLDDLAGTADAAERRAAEPLRARLVARRDEAYRALLADGLAEFDELAGRLRDRLASWTVEVRLDGGEDERPRPFRAALGEELARHADRLLGALERLGRPPDPAAAHRARIEAKRLRYLLEPVAPVLAPAREPVRGLRELQDLLGGANDLAVLAAELAAEAAEAERSLVTSTAAGGARRRRRGGRPGRAALARGIAARRAALWQEFEARWGDRPDGSARALAAGLGELVEALAET